ncbi:hypothetical protein M2152_002620 [Microbacteriaceae bacterium SG_E_30_P1]|uniref:Uncharacterized protein n=1 Tax=Antiquaquibacter oligotrophicus TaxID=2880260 RepID=A0ABT6KSG3_9MICO|nr:hypothetical protein [Antiquaquibacter oligotrophicus]MDH6182438.1 hypothetical protein [Antiquaquibacter oligotrophicus]UDF14591.1 hypothetical protein LH407_06945 [Antiquaquibacter oligotrophicus]
MRREIVTWSVVAAILLGAFGITVAVLNTTVYSASGFVSSYMDAIMRKDAAGALEIMGGLPEDNEFSDTLLRREAMTDVTDVSVVSDTEVEGIHRVTVQYKIGDTEGRTSFEVESTGVSFGIFPMWEFTSGPLSRLYVTVVGDARFSVNGQDLATAAPDEPTGYLAFVPGNFELSHETTFLEAAPETVALREAGASVPTAVITQPNEHMIQVVQEDVNEGLDACTDQQILQPTGCPFGQAIVDRIVSPPTWSISQYPEVSIRISTRTGEWIVPPTAGAAHLTVDVKSLFDGDVSTFDEDVPFEVSYAVSLLPGDDLLITARYE